MAAKELEVVLEQVVAEKEHVTSLPHPVRGMFTTPLVEILCVSMVSFMQ